MITPDTNTPVASKSVRPLGAMLGLLAMLGTTGTRAQEIETPPEAPPIFDGRALTQRLVELRPDIERVLGVSLGPPITVRSVDSKELAHLLGEERVIMSILAGNLGPPTKTLKKGRFSDRLFASDLLGKLEVATDTVLIQPRTFKFLTNLLREPATLMSQGFLDVILIHEAVHVFQNREFGVLRTWASTQPLIAECVLEGHAEWVTRRVARLRGIEHHHEFFTRLVQGLVPTKSALTGVLIKAFSQHSAFPYVRGRTFFEDAVKQVGYEAALAHAFLSPPSDLLVLLDNEPWTALQKPLEARSKRREATRTLRGKLLGPTGDAPASFEFWVWSGQPDPRGWVARGNKGDFTVQVPENVALFGGHVEIEGKRHLDLVGVALFVTHANTLSLRLDRPPELIVRVVEEDSRRPVANARVAWSAKVFPEGRPPLSRIPISLPKAWVRCDVHGEARLSLQEASEGLVAQAPGHACGALKFAPQGNGRVEMALPRGGNLFVTVPSFQKLTDVSVELVDRDEDLRGTRDLDGQGHAKFEGLLAGRYTVLLLQRVAGKAETLATRRLRMRDGEERSIELGPLQAPRMPAPDPNDHRK